MKLESTQIELDVLSNRTRNKSIVLIIYDIADNKRRRILFKKLKSYGFSIQKSAFEAKINSTSYRKLLKELPEMLEEKEDSIRIYKFHNDDQITNLGLTINHEMEDVIIV